jgi:hypothetical protein
VSDNIKVNEWAVAEEMLRLREQVEKLERENAALRADKERLEWLMSGHVISTVFTFNRAAIDAARKEAQQ